MQLRKRTHEWVPMRDRREPSLSTDEFPLAASHEPERVARGPAFREPAETNDQEPSLVFWVAAIALGVLLGGLGVKVVTDWYESRQAEAALRQFAVTVNNVTQQTNRQLAASVAVANAQAADARAHTAAVAEKQRAQEMALRTEQQRIERLRVAAVEQAAAEKAKREAAWAKFYRPSSECQTHESRATMRCANEYARAQKEFNQRWSQGTM